MAPTFPVFQRKPERTTLPAYTNASTSPYTWGTDLSEFYRII